MINTPSRHSSRSEHPSRARDAPRGRQRSASPPLPEYEPPLAPLNEAGHTALITLLKSQKLRQLKTHLQHAELKLTDSAGEVNERLTDARVRHQRQKERARERSKTDDGGDDEDGDSKTRNMDVEADGGEPVRLTNLEAEVKSVTETLDARMRRAIDSEAQIDGMMEILNKIEGEVEQEVRARPRQSARRSRRGDMDMDEEGEDGEEDDGEEAESSPEREMSEISVLHKLDERLSEDRAKWDELSLTERYSKNNSYIGFYRIIHEAKHPGDDIPPLPHASTWFSHLEDPTSQRASNASEYSRRETRQQNQGASPTDDDEVAVASERFSNRCPLTLLPFQDPVTSTKCPHSFEREAIVDMINNSKTTVAGPPSSGKRRIRSVKCPVCSEVLTIDDLRQDPALLRRVRRAEQHRVQEDEEMELDGPRGARSRRSNFTVASDEEEDGEGPRDEMDIDSEDGRSRSRTLTQQVRIKKERTMSVSRKSMSRGVSSRPGETENGADEEEEEEGEEEEEEEEDYDEEEEEEEEEEEY